ncbi:MAG: hypothetical protein HY241_04510 [Actinobacteria bacterium]|nr:hypothetical protein [Actinomycetota bacterium]
MQVSSDGPPLPSWVRTGIATAASVITQTVVTGGTFVGCTAITGGWGAPACAVGSWAAGGAAGGATYGWLDSVLSGGNDADAASAAANGALVGTAAGVVGGGAGAAGSKILGTIAARAALPKLVGSIADSFAGGAYTTQTSRAGTTFYRAEGAKQGIGSFFGFAKPATASDADKLYNIVKWGNNADVVTTYRLTQDTTMYVGDVAGGTGRQALLPRGTDPGSIFAQIDQESLP